MEPSRTGEGPTHSAFFPPLHLPRPCSSSANSSTGAAGQQPPNPTSHLLKRPLTINEGSSQWMRCTRGRPFHESAAYRGNTLSKQKSFMKSDTLLCACCPFSPVQLLQLTASLSHSCSLSLSPFLPLSLSHWLPLERRED